MKNRRFRGINLLIVLAVLALAAFPLVLGLGDDKDEPFSGSDAQAETAITEHDPGYKPWFSPWWTPPSGEVESGIFAAQAALGAGFLGYAGGVLRTRRRLADRAATPAAAADTPAPAPGRPVATTEPRD